MHFPNVNRPEVNKKLTERKPARQVINLKGQQAIRHASQGDIPDEKRDIAGMQTETILSVIAGQERTRSKYMDYGSGLTPSSTTFYDSKVGKKVNDARAQPTDQKHRTLDKFTKGIMKIQENPQASINHGSQASQSIEDIDITHGSRALADKYAFKTTNHFFGINNNKSIKPKEGHSHLFDKKRDSARLPQSVQAELNINILKNQRIKANHNFADRSKSVLEQQPLGIHGLVAQAHNESASQRHLEQ